MKICGRCGSGNEDSSKFCINCGAPLQTQRENTQKSHYENSRNEQYGSGPQRQSGSYSGRGHSAGGGTREEIIYTDVTSRSVPLAVVLTIVTCGIYGLYWIYKLNDEINELAQDETAPGGGLVVVLFIITCGIYGLYWLYRMGEKCDYIAQTRTSNNIIYLILGIIGLGIVAIALMQDTINRVLE